MTNQAPQPLITKTRVEAFFASALAVLGLLLGAILRGGFTGRSKRLRLVLSRTEAMVECILFVKAVSLYGPPPKQKTHPRLAASGFRRIQGRRLALFYRGARIRARKANALARVLALIEALTRPERAIAYFFKRICNGLHLGRLIITAPPAHALISLAHHEPCAADTS